MQFLEGKKTYIAAIAIVLSAIGGFLAGDLSLGQAVTTVLEGLGFAALRAAK